MEVPAISVVINHNWSEWKRMTAAEKWVTIISDRNYAYNILRI